MRRFDRFLMLFVTSFVAGACYKYTPVESPQRGMDVRAQLETEAAVRRSQGLDDPILRYDGVIVDLTPDVLSLDVLIARSTSAFQDVTIRDTITLETAEVRSIMRRTISPLRTALFTVATGVAAFGIVKSIDAVVGGTGDDDDDNGTTTLVVPVLSWTGSQLLPVLLRRRNE